MVGFLLILVAGNFMPWLHSSIKLTKKSPYPNIIIIGFDALRPDFIGPDNAFNTMTPHFNDFLKTSVHFTEAFTPLARTTPSWTTILTGRYPHHTFSSGNNINTSFLDLTETLPKKLKHIGYETIYATDDRRYNSINKEYGFDQIIGPATGVNDFILGTFNDFPLSNLIIPTRLGKILFPFNYANHGDNITYRPNNFLDLIQDNLKLSGKPLFFAVHFNLTGWPFYCSHPNTVPDEDVVNNYKNCVHEADKVFSTFLTLLQKEGLLRKTIVIFLSDHGVTLGLPHDRVISLEKYSSNPAFIKKISIVKYHNTPAFSCNFTHDYGIDTSFGYGGDVLSLKQTKTILAFKLYGMDSGFPRNINDYVSLLDITPTVLDLLTFSPLNDSDGISLKPYFLHTSMQKSNLQRVFYFETSFSIPDMETDRIVIDKLLKKVIYLYSLDSQTGEIYINPNLISAITQRQQHATLKNNKLLAYMPSDYILKVVWDKQTRKKKLAYVTVPGYQILVNLQNGKWSIEP
ncbi:MAG: sulfatase-like hydrolase/transferase [Gammaproteobacteria bacterium]|nr:sulfatase-like hydrolase/transferase [Gammaproteobacteria bacterium]